MVIILCTKSDDRLKILQIMNLSQLFSYIFNAKYFLQNVSNLFYPRTLFFDDQAPSWDCRFFYPKLIISFKILIQAQVSMTEWAREIHVIIPQSFN